MAYSRRKGQQCPIPADPGLLWSQVTLTTAEVNIPVRVPWNNVRLSYAYAVYIGIAGVAGGALHGGDWEIDLELDVAAGTELMTISVVSGTAVGTETEATYSDEQACGGLSDQSTIMIESDGATATTGGAAIVYMYFEQE